MSVKQDHFKEPSRIEKRRGAVAQAETNWGTYTIFEKNGRVWIEAYGHGGIKRSMPHVDSIDEAKELVYNQYTKPLPPEEKISF